MELIRMKCPSCDANLEVDSEREFFFCSYCGCRIMVHDTDMVNARVRIKEMEHEERMQQNEHEQERYMAASKSWLEKRREAKAEATRLALEERRLALEEQEKKQQLEREKTQQIMEARLRAEALAEAEREKTAREDRKRKFPGIILIIGVVIALIFVGKSCVSCIDSYIKEGAVRDSIQAVQDSIQAEADLQEVAKLESIYAEAMLDYKAGNYDDALLKAQLLRFTGENIDEYFRWSRVQNEFIKMVNTAKNPTSATEEELTDSTMESDTSFESGSELEN